MPSDSRPLSFPSSALREDDLSRQLGPSPLVSQASDSHRHSVAHSPPVTDEMDSQGSGVKMRRALSDGTTPIQSDFICGVTAMQSRSRRSAGRSERLADCPGSRSSVNAERVHSRNNEIDDQRSSESQSVQSSLCSSRIVSEGDVQLDFGALLGGLLAGNKGTYIFPAETAQQGSESASNISHGNPIMNHASKLSGSEQSSDDQRNYGAELSVPFRLEAASDQTV